MKKTLLLAASILILALVSFLFWPKAAGAIPPPDIIVNITQSLFGIIGSVVAFFVAGFYMIKDSIFTWKNKAKEKK